MTIRTLLVDDEPLARERLKRLMSEHADFDCVGEAGDGEAALSWLRQFHADLVLLDIQMPGPDGLAIAEQIQQLPLPAGRTIPRVIFCTAYDEHALAAFRVNALDYLLKPISRNDLSSALAKVAASLQQAQPQVKAARTHLRAASLTGTELIPLDQVLYISADQKYACVHHLEGETLIDESLKQLEQEFAQRFVRVHRNALIARDRIERLQALNDGGHQVFLRGVENGIAVSRRHLAGLRKVIKQL